MFLLKQSLGHLKERRDKLEKLQLKRDGRCMSLRAPSFQLDDIDAEHEMLKDKTPYVRCSRILERRNPGQTHVIAKSSLLIQHIELRIQEDPTSKAVRGIYTPIS